MPLSRQARVFAVTTPLQHSVRRFLVFRMYTVKEIFFSIQGEGAHRGRPAVFCRFSGCNLWSGREADRANSICHFCDTDFVGVNHDGGKFQTADELIDAILEHFPTDLPDRYLIFTGGEPLLQLDQDLIAAAKSAGCEIAVETNGTLLPPAGIDWICVSPKMGSNWILKQGDELKVVFPQRDCDLAELAKLDFQRFFLQPMDGPQLSENTQRAYHFCQLNPTWELSIQTQKLVGIR